MAQNAQQVQIQGQQQIQTLSPQQVQIVKLLELPTVEFEERIHSEILDNPALDEWKDTESASGMDDNPYVPGEDDGYTDDGGDMTSGDYQSPDDIPDNMPVGSHHNGEGAGGEIPFSDAVSFYEIIIDQLKLQELTEEEYQIADYLIGSLDHDGLLRADTQSLLHELATYHQIDTDKETVERMLSVIQSFDPAGVGARSLQECLLLQLRRKPDTPIKKLEEEVIGKYFDELGKNNRGKIIQRLNIDQETYEKVLNEIKKLNPRPGSSLGESMGKNMQLIVPDFLVETDDNGIITLNLNNRNVPDLRLSREYSVMLEEHTKNKKNQSKESQDAFLFLKQKVDAARSFIDAVKRRQKTLLVTMQAIIDIQHLFFQEGNEALLKPMILKDVAEKANLDVSTVSRVCNSKYVQTNYGIFSLKHFFSDGFTTEEGEELSVRKIKQILKEMVDNENKNKPYTDDELAEELEKRGYPVARRTVAKYRNQLHIPVARLRRI